MSSSFSSLNIFFCTDILPRKPFVFSTISSVFLSLSMFWTVERSMANVKVGVMLATLSATFTYIGSNVPQMVVACSYSMHFLPILKKSSTTSLKTGIQSICLKMALAHSLRCLQLLLTRYQHYCFLPCHHSCRPSSSCALLSCMTVSFSPSRASKAAVKTLSSWLFTSCKTSFVWPSIFLQQ